MSLLILVSIRFEFLIGFGLEIVLCLHHEQQPVCKNKNFR